MRQAKLTAILITFIFVDPVKSVPRFFCSCLLILFFLIQHIYPFIISCYICLLLFSKLEPMSVICRASSVVCRINLLK